MSNIAFLDVVNQIARAAMSGTALPSINGKLLSQLQITGIFFSGDAAVTIDANSGKCVIKPKEAPAGAPALIDTLADLVTVGSDTHYVFAWTSADSAELRAYLDAQPDPTQPVEMRCEIEYAIDGDVARIAFPIMMQTSYSRPEDPAPSAAAETSWPWLKAHAPEANGFTHNDETKTLGLAPHTHAIGDVTGLQGALDGKAATSHSHAIGDVTGLQGALDGKAATSHSHAIGDVTGLQGALDGKAATSHSHAIGDVTGLQGALDGKAATSHSHAIGDVTGLQGALDAKQGTSTLGADSAAAVHAATSKTTPADGDEIGAADSAASFGLKRFTWANIKAALKTYFDTLYAAITHASRHKSGGADAIKLDELAAPTDVTTLNATTGAHGLLPKLGGGTTNFLRADGTWAAPAGGGGALVRGSGVLRGNTTPHGAPTPANCYVNMSVVSGSGFLTFDFSGSPVTLTFDTSDPFDGSIWIDNTSFSSAYDYASAVESYLLTQTAYVTNVVRSEFNITFDSLATGSVTYINVTTSLSGVGTSGYVTGTDGPDGYGAVLEVEIIPAVSGKIMYPLRVWGSGSGVAMNMDVCLKEGGAYYPLTNEFYANLTAWEALNTGAAVVSFSPYAVRWFNGLLSGSVVARLLGPTADGGDMTIYAICEQRLQ